MKAFVIVSILAIAILLMALIRFLQTSKSKSADACNKSKPIDPSEEAKPAEAKPAEAAPAPAKSGSSFSYIIIAIIVVAAVGYGWKMREHRDQVDAEKEKATSAPIRSSVPGKMAIQSDGLTILVDDPRLTKVTEDEEEVTFKRTSSYDLRFRKESKSFRVVIHNCPEEKKEEVRRIAERDLMHSLGVDDQNTFCHLRIGLYYIPGRMKVDSNTDTNWGFSFCNKHKRF